MLKKILWVVCAVVLLCVGAVIAYVYPSYAWMVAVKTVKYDSGLTVYIGGGNTTVLTSSDGKQAIIIDTKKKRSGETLRKKIHAQDITIINTHIHHDHTKMNKLYPNATVLAGNYSREEWKKETAGCKYPDRTLDAGKDTTFLFGNEQILIRNIGKAHTTNDLVIYLPNHKMLIVGDLIFHKMHPAIFKGEANCNNLINILDSLYNSSEDDIIVIPGHGKITDRNGILKMKEYYMSLYNAANNPESFISEKKKYRHYFTFMGVNGFDQNVDFVKWEKNQQSTDN